jgi:diguanylate cyclase (GGDEF)-like protein/PAS domain S-box-containing protein
MASRWWSGRRGVFSDLAKGMMAFGVLIGLVFPFFARALGVPTRYALQTRFWSACLAAGVLLGLINWLLARQVIGKRLRVLSDQMTHVGAELRTASLHGDFSAGPPQALRLPVESTDDLGRTASAFNDLLSAVETEHRFRSLVEATSDVICLIDTSGTLRFVSSSVRTVLGWSPERFVGQPVADLVHPDDSALALTLTLPVAAATSGDAVPADTETTTLRVRHAEHGWRRLEVSVSDRRDDPEISALVLTARDVTDRYVLQRRLAHQALHDGLTGLPNRAALVEAGEDLLSQVNGSGDALSVVLMDLDRFKEINDTLGHSYGDRLLTNVAQRLQGLLRTGDMLARLGGDEFAVLMPGLDRHAAPAAARRLLDAFVESFTIDGLDLDVQASIGVAVADHGPPPNERGIDALLREADIAMYTAKEVQTGVEVYDPEADIHTRSRLVLLSELRRGMVEGQIVLHYQPKIALGTGELVGVEARVRWEHPTRGMLLPEHFLSIVEQTGLITTLSDIVLDMALAQTSAWLRDGHAVQVAVNLSARYLHHLDLPDRIFEALARHHVPARLLRLELTESALIADPAKALSILERLHDGGVRLSIDDFGTGYSSMSYLKRLPVDELKVDRSFVGGMTTSVEDAALVRSVVDLGHNLGMEVVAEGVEDPLTTTALAELKCDVGQGFHFAHPAPASEIAVWLQRMTGGTSADGRPIVTEQAVDHDVVPGSMQKGGAT